MTQPPESSNFDALLAASSLGAPHVKAAATYNVPALARAEVPSNGWTPPRLANCPQCLSGTPVPHWPSKVACRSSFRRGDDGIERLFRVHCTCDHCF